MFSFNNKELKCVILCGGRGSRLWPFSLLKQKGMIEIYNKPALGYIIDYWRKFTDNFIFVVKYRKDDIIDYVETLPVNFEFVEPQELRGIDNGIYQAKDYVEEFFIVTPGDCICRGRFNFPSDMQQGVAILRTDNGYYCTT